MKRLITLTIALLMTCSLAMGFSSCGSTNGEAVKVRNVEDCAGRQVNVPEDPQRVACLFASGAHMMAMLDEQDKIVGCPDGVKSDLLMKMKYPKIVDTATPHQEGAVNIEEMVRIKADLAIVNAQTSGDEGEMAKLDEMHIPYVVIDYYDIDGLRKAIRVMGQTMNEEEKAENYIEFMDQTIDMVTDKLAEVPKDEWPEVFHSSNEATRTDTDENICSEIMNLACVKDISVEKGIAGGNGKSEYVTLEEIYKWDPDAIIANEYSVVDYVLSDAKWQGLTAVKKGAVYNLPIGATRWCHPGSMEAHMGVLAVAVQFYPEKFEGFAFKDYVKDYYQKYFDIELEDEIIDNIFSGQGMRRVNSPTN